MLCQSIRFCVLLRNLLLCFTSEFASVFNFFFKLPAKLYDVLLILYKVFEDMHCRFRKHTLFVFLSVYLSVSLYACLSVSFSLFSGLSSLTLRVISTGQHPPDSGCPRLMRTDLLSEANRECLVCPDMIEREVHVNFECFVYDYESIINVYIEPKAFR